MKRKCSNGIYFVIIVFIAFCFSAISSVAFALNGNGTEENPYQIWTFEDFQEFASNSAYWKNNIYTQLEANIDLDPLLPGRRIYDNAVIAADGGSKYYYVGWGFLGIFNGFNFAISNLTINSSHHSLGLFGGNSGTIINTHITGALINGTEAYVGALVGGNFSDGKIENCSSSAQIIGGNYTGGLIGRNSGNVVNCYAIGNVKGKEEVGGLIGENIGSVENCYSNSNVIGRRSLGGLIGWNTGGGHVSNCYATGSVDGSSYGLDVGDGFNVGGLIGSNGLWPGNGYVSNCYATGNVSGIKYVGGLIGDHYSSTGKEAERSFWDTQTSDMSISEGGTGLTTLQMKQQANFTGWDFLSTWNIVENGTYPFLRALNEPPFDCVGFGIDCTDSDCVDAGGYWCNGVCQENECESKYPILSPPTLTVETSGLNVNLNWTEVNNATSYTLYYADYQNPTEFFSKDFGNSLFFNINLSHDMRYLLKVTAMNHSGESSFSNTVTVEMPEAEDNNIQIIEADLFSNGSDYIKEQITNVLNGIFNELKDDLGLGFLDFDFITDGLLIKFGVDTSSITQTPFLGIEVRIYSLLPEGSERTTYLVGRFKYPEIELFFAGEIKDGLLDMTGSAAISEIEDNAYLEERPESTYCAVKFADWTWKLPGTSQKTISDLIKMGLIESEHSGGGI